jgi:hypothetical protein
MSILDWSFLDPVGRAVIDTIETVISLSAITSLLSLSAALVATWVMQGHHPSGRAWDSQCAASTGAAHCTRRACDFSDAQCRNAVHYARPALARQSAAGRRDHGFFDRLRVVAHQGGAGAIRGGARSQSQAEVNSATHHLRVSILALFPLPRSA